jgi:hypothetical protein
MEVPAVPTSAAAASNTAMLGNNSNVHAQDGYAASMLTNFAMNPAVMTMAAAANGDMNSFNMVTAALGMNQMGMNFGPYNSASQSMPIVYHGAGGHGDARQGGSDHVYNHPTEAGLEQKGPPFNGNNWGAAHQGGTDLVYNHDTENNEQDSKPAAIPVAFNEGKAEGLSPISNK